MSQQQSEGQGETCCSRAQLTDGAAHHYGTIWHTALITRAVMGCSRHKRWHENLATDAMLHGLHVEIMASLQGATTYATRLPTLLPSAPHQPTPRKSRRPSKLCARARLDSARAVVAGQANATTGAAWVPAGRAIPSRTTCRALSIACNSLNRPGEVTAMMTGNSEAMYAAPSTATASNKDRPLPIGFDAAAAESRPTPHRHNRPRAGACTCLRARRARARRRLARPFRPRRMEGPAGR